MRNAPNQTDERADHDQREDIRHDESDHREHEAQRPAEQGIHEAGDRGSGDREFHTHYVIGALSVPVTVPLMARGTRYSQGTVTEKLRLETNNMNRSDEDKHHERAPKRTERHL